MGLVRTSTAVAKGYMEIPGVDYSEPFAPVVKDETFCLVLIMYLLKSSGMKIDKAE